MAELSPPTVHGRPRTLVLGAGVVLLRHATYVGHRPGHHAHPDADLSPTGRTQARTAAAALPYDIAGIVTSPLLRARRTAEIIADHADLPLIATSTLLAEWRAPSELFGLGPDDYPPEYRAWRNTRTANPDTRYGDGESLTELYGRARAAADWLTGQTAGHGPLVAVSHAVLLRVLTQLPHGPEDFENAARTGWPLCTAEAWSPDQSATTP